VAIYSQGLGGEGEGAMYTARKFLYEARRPVTVTLDRVNELPILLTTCLVSWEGVSCWE